MSYYKSTWTNTVTRLNACVCRTRAPTPARPTLPTTAGHGPATCAPAAPAPGAHEDTQHTMEVPGARPQCARLAADAAGGAVAGGVSVVCVEALTQDASRRPRPKSTWPWITIKLPRLTATTFGCAAAAGLDHARRSPGTLPTTAPARRSLDSRSTTAPARGLPGIPSTTASARGLPGIPSTTASARGLPGTPPPTACAAPPPAPAAARTCAGTARAAACSPPGAAGWCAGADAASRR